MDLIFTNQPTKYRSPGAIHTALIDHSLVFAIRKKKDLWKSKSKLHEFRKQIRKIDFILLLDNPEDILGNVNYTI